MGLSAGTKLGPYEILAPLGAGGMGEVYRARDTRLGRDVAVKVLPGGFADDPRALAWFESEARTVAALSHPNILALFDVGESGGFHYAVTELLQGQTSASRSGTDPSPSATRWTSRPRSPGRSTRRTRTASSIATSSPRTSSSVPAAR